MDAPYEFFIIVEAKADYQTATGIAERVIRAESPEWLRGYLEVEPATIFLWAGLTPNLSFSLWRDIAKISDDLIRVGYKPPRYLGFKDFNGFDYASGWIVLQMVDFLKSKYHRNIPAVFFIRDGDNQIEDRIKSLKKLQEEYRDKEARVIIGFAIPKREAWVLNGYDPQNEKEERLLQNLSRELNFNPCTNAHRLRGKINQPGTQERDIKRVLGELVDNDLVREEQCWQTASIEVLLARGHKTGLSDYIKNVREFIMPILAS